MVTWTASSVSFHGLLLLGLFGCAAGTHFRYGVISWWVGQDSLAGVRDNSGRPVYQAVFEVKGAWRRDYSWGALFNEQWRASSTDNWRQAAVANGDFDCSSVTDHNPTTSGIQCFEEGSSLIASAEQYSSYQIRFPTGVGFEGLPLPPSGLQCTSPLHKGLIESADIGEYGGPGPTLGVLRPELDDGFWGVSGKEDKTTTDSEDDLDGDKGALPPATNISSSGVCAPWAESYGFFFGDSGSAEEVVVTVTDIDFDRGLVGNVLRATSAYIVHNYTSPYDNSVPLSPKPWVAYWTAGNRLTELQNNADGRFRLEIDVRFLTTGCSSAAGCTIISNRSPVAAQIPVMPVVYPASGVASFQVAAYDPDYSTRQDQVRYFVGNQQEHGYILANYVRYFDIESETVKEDPTYYPDVYHRVICERRVGNASVCTDPVLVGPNKVVVFGLNYTGVPELTAERSPDATLYGPWDPRVNIAHAPYDINGDVLSIGARNGMVSWEVGASPSSGLAPGFYQLTVMVEERMSHEFWQTLDQDTVFRTLYTSPGADYYAGYDPASGDDMVGSNGDFERTPTSRGGGAKVPVDFMLYLYPAMHYCSANCDRTSSGNIMQTFESADGLYGDPIADNRPGDGLPGPGTGQCKICGGGGSYTNVLGDSGMVYDNVVKDSLTYCQVINTRRAEPIQAAYARGYDNQTGVEEYGLWRASLPSDAAWKDYNDTCSIATTSFSDGRNCLEEASCNTEWTFQGCLGVSWEGADSIIPYDGIFDTCQINNPPRFITECDCDGTAWQSETGNSPVFTPSMQGCLYNMRADGTGIERASFVDCCVNPTTLLVTDSPSTAEYAGMFRAGTVRGILGLDLFFDLVATDDDQCVELVIGDTGLPSVYMELEPHDRIDRRTVSRRFTFNPPPETNGSATADPRETFTKVCFYVTDKYLLTAYPFHCLHIELVPPVAAKWCDEDASNGLPAPSNATHGNATNTLDEYAVFQAYAGEQVSLPLCVYKSESPNVEHRMQILPITEGMPGDFPNMYNFSYPHDSVNFPPQRADRPTPASIAGVPAAGWYFTETLDAAGDPLTTDDPYYRTFMFTPDATQECVYTVCFRGVDVEAAADLDDPEETPTQFTSVRCYRFEVYNSVLEFNGESEAQVAGLSEAVTIADGFSMAAWVMPSCVSAGTNMTAMYFGSVRRFPARQTAFDTGLPLRNSIKWAQTSDDGLGRFYYEDWRVGIKATPVLYACDAWHFVAFTVTEEHAAILYVDGTEPEGDGPASAHTRVSTQLNFTTPSRPDTPDDITTSTGRFVLGSHMGHQALVGQLDDVYVWNRALRPEEVATVMTSRTLFSEDAVQEGLLAWFPMRDGAGGGELPLADYALSSSTSYTLVSTGTTAPVVVDAATPAVVPCVLGLEMPVGPTDGLCVQSVYGWNFARGPFLAARFGDITVPATFVNDTEIVVETPGHVSPRFVSVTASNNGKTFTHEAGAGRLTEFLYMDAGLYMDGSEGGALADGVCPDLPDRAVTFGAWVCVDCGQPVVHYDAPHPGQPNPEPEGRPEPPRDEILRPLREMGAGEPTLYE